MKHKLISWEQNGYHDSYFYMIYWDSDLGEVAQVETGSTAYGGGGVSEGQFILPTRPVLIAAERWLARFIYGALRSAEDRNVLEPEDVTPYEDEVALLRKVKHKGQQYEKGTVGRVFWVGAFGTFYSNGYNRPGRDNRRVGIELSSGEKIYVALKACRLNRETLSDFSLMRKARALAKNRQFGACFPRFSWASEQWTNVA